MENSKSYITTIFLLAIAVYSENVIGQTFLPDTVYSNQEMTTEIRFPYNIKDAGFSSKPSSYDFTGTAKSIIINGAKTKNAKSDILSITTDKGEYRFVVVYKADIPPPNILDLSTPKKLEQHYKALAAGNLPKIVDTEKEIKDKTAAIEKEKQKQDANKYNTLITEAKDLFAQKNYIKARDRYQQAADLKPGDPVATKQIEEMNNLIKDEELRKSQNATTETYKNVMQNADKAFNQGEFASARIFYTQALNYKPGDPIATKRIQDIDNKEKQKQQLADLENSYKDAMSAGDKYFATGDLDNAKQQYTKAYSLIKRSEPQEQIKKIDKLIRDNTSKTLAENRKKEKEKEADLKYQKLIESANAEFKTENYAKAKQLFKSATAMKPSDPYPVDMLTKIETALTRIETERKVNEDNAAKEKTTNKLYNAALSKAKSFYQKGDLINAKAAYTEASSLKPSEEEPLKQITLITKNLADIEAAKKREILQKQEEEQSKYSNAVNRGREAQIAKRYEEAMGAYKEAQAIRYSKDIQQIINNIQGYLDRTNVKPATEKKKKGKKSK